MIVRELIVSVDDKTCRHSWSARGEPLTHHNASVEVFSAGQDKCRVVWIADLMPNEVAEAIEQMIQQGLTTMKQTLESRRPMANNEADLLATSRGRLSATLGPYTPKLKEDFNMPIKATCHCGATQFEVSETPTSVTECNCTFCFKRGVLWAYYSPEQVRFVKNDRTTVYTSDESSHKHHHCSVCGCGAYNEMYCSWG
jgi:hypothetical protein